MLSVASPCVNTLLNQDISHSLGELVSVVTSIRLHVAACVGVGGRPFGTKPNPGITTIAIVLIVGDYADPCSDSG